MADGLAENARSMESQQPMSAVGSSESGSTRCRYGHELADRDQVHYCDYLSLETLLSLTVPFAESGRHRPRRPDEHGFMTAHLACELVFSTLLHDLDAIIKHVGAGRYERARALLRRCAAWAGALRGLLGPLFLVRRDDFAVLRETLRPASGAESIQFRLIELRSGVRPETPYAVEGGRRYTYREWLDRAPGHGENEPRTRLWTPALEAEARRPSVACALRAALRRENLSLADLYAGPAPTEGRAAALRRLHDAFYVYEEAMRAFRSKPPERGGSGRAKAGHAELAERHLGRQAGTGHTSGAAYLRATTARATFYPELRAFKHPNDTE